jgi:hypothetical protein
MRQYQIDNLISMLTSVVVVAVITVTALRVWRRSFEAKHELRRQLLDKMTSNEMVRILESEEGRRSIAALVGEAESGRATAVVGRGVTLIIIGFALGLSAAISHLPLVGTAGLVAIAGGSGQLVVAWLISRERRT